jgi:phosphoglucomutase
MDISKLAGKPADPSLLINVARLVTAYYTRRPDPSVSAQRVMFGTSGHRGCALDSAFNEAHILAVTQAICSAHLTIRGSTPRRRRNRRTG